MTSEDHRLFIHHSRGGDILQGGAGAVENRDLVGRGSSGLPTTHHVSQLRVDVGHGHRLGVQSMMQVADPDALAQDIHDQFSPLQKIWRELLFVFAVRATPATNVPGTTSTAASNGRCDGVQVTMMSQRWSTSRVESHCRHLALQFLAHLGGIRFRRRWLTIPREHASDIADASQCAQVAAPLIPAPENREGCVHRSGRGISPRPPSRRRCAAS